MNFKNNCFIFFVVILIISCNELVPMGYDLKIVSHNIPATTVALKAEPIVIKFSEPLDNYTIDDKNKNVDISVYLIGEKKFGNSDIFKKELSKDKTELIFIAKDGYYMPNSKITIFLDGCISEKRQALNKITQQFKFEFETERVFFVNSKSSSGDYHRGLSWKDAFSTLPDALYEIALYYTTDNGKNRDKNSSIWIAKGEYFQDGIGYSNIRHRVNIIGGFNGDEKYPVDIVDPTLTKILYKDFSQALYSRIMFSIDNSYTNSNSDRVIKNLEIKFSITAGNATIFNCVIYYTYSKFYQESYSIHYDGGVSLLKNGMMKNCTVVKNGYLPTGESFNSNSSTGLFAVETAVIEDTIIWGNFTDSAKNITQIKSEAVTLFKNCAIEGGTAGLDGTFTDCIDLNSDNDNVAGPNFVDVTNKNFMLKNSSTCIGKGLEGKNIGAFTGVQ